MSSVPLCCPKNVLAPSPISKSPTAALPQPSPSPSKPPQAAGNCS